MSKTLSDLLVQAAREIIATMHFFVAEDMSREKMAAFANEVGDTAGIPNLGSGRTFNAEFNRISAELDEWVRNKATAEMQAALAQAEAEQAYHKAKLLEFGQSLDERLEIIDVGRKNNRIGDTTSFYDGLESLTRGHHTSVREIIQQMHREALKYAFTSHLVGKETAVALADFYEIK